MATNLTTDAPSQNDSNQAPRIIGKLLNIGGMLQRHGDRVLKPFGLNQRQFSILFEIAKAGRVSQKDMVNRLVLEKAHVSKVVKKLGMLELIAIETSDDDRRSTWLSATSAGKRMLGRCMRTLERWNREWLEDFTDEQLDSILENLTQLQSVFKART